MFARNALVGWLVLVAFTAAGCGVDKKKHAAKVKEAKEANAKLGEAQKTLKKREQAIALAQADLKKAHDRAHGAQKVADDAKQSMETLKKDFAKKMKASEKEVEALAKARLEAEKASKLLKNLTGKLEPLIKKKQIAIRIVHGRMVIKLRSKVLFISGSAKLLKYGQRTLKRIAKHLKEIEGSHFQVAGHTDNVKITKGDYKDNWELSTARALTVVKFLEEQGVEGNKLSAAGFSQFQPVATNKRVWGRRMNRRIEITLLPHVTRQLLKGPPKRSKRRRRK